MAHDRTQIRTIEISVKGKWITVPALEVEGNIIVVNGRWIRVASIHAEEWLERELEDPEVCLDGLKEQRTSDVRADIFTFSQKLPVTQPKHPYHMERESIAAIHVKSFKDWWEELPQESRKNVRRSQRRGVVVSVKTLDDDLIREIADLNSDSPIRQGLPFAHYGKTRDMVKKDQSSFLGRSDFVCAHVGSELIGFLKIVRRGEIASILQLLPKASRHDLRPANALIAKAVELCAQKGVSHLTYGKYHYGNQGMTSLLEFKVRNGFEEVLMPRYYIPLTQKGRIATMLKLHRDLVGILPQSVVCLGRTLRAKWYSLRAVRAPV